VRFLPSTLVIMIAGPIAGRLTDRVGARPLISLGLLLVSGSLFWQGHLSPDTPYGFLAGAFVLMGFGMGLVMSPMSTAAMNSVEPTKAGVASGILSMSRMVGGSFGVAAMGALISALGSHRLGQLLPGLSDSARSKLTDALGSGAGSAASGRTATALQDSFVYALNNGLRIGSLVALVGAVVAFVMIEPKRKARAGETEPLPATPAPESIAA
jgi:MFS family permease